MLKRLREDHSILIKPADKGNVVIIIDREQCVRGRHGSIHLGVRDFTFLQKHMTIGCFQMCPQEDQYCQITGVRVMEWQSL